MELEAYRRTTATVQERLSWIGKNELRFPAVASFARHILVVPETQIEKERVFSLSVHIANPMRNRLKNTAIDKMVSAGRNYPGMDNIEKQDFPTIPSMQEVSDFLNNAKDLEERGDIHNPVFSPNLGVNDGVINERTDIEEESTGIYRSRGRK